MSCLMLSIHLILGFPLPGHLLGSHFIVCITLFFFLHPQNITYQRKLACLALNAMFPLSNLLQFRRSSLFSTQLYGSYDGFADLHFQFLQHSLVTYHIASFFPLIPCGVHSCSNSFLRVSPVSRSHSHVFDLSACFSLMFPLSTIATSVLSLLLTVTSILSMFTLRPCLAKPLFQQVLLKLILTLNVRQ